MTKQQEPGYRHPQAPAWLTVGATVGIYSSRSYREGSDFIETTVERFTATTVVLANRARFRLSDATREVESLTRYGSDTWAASTFCVPPGSERFRTMKIRRRLLTKRQAAVKAVGDWQRRGGTDDIAQARAAIEALESYLTIKIAHNL